MLEIQDVTFGYNSEAAVLENIQIRFDTRSTAIIGQNGAGKTTLVKLIKGLLRPTSGKILWENNDISSQSVAQIAKDIGLVFQNPDDQIFKHRVLDEVMFGPRMIGMDEEKSLAVAIEALEAVGLKQEHESNPYDLSLSERKMIAIASVLAMNPQVIILDEPTIAQDAKGKARIKAIILKLRAEGKQVITIIHDMDFVASCFERTVVLAQGRVLLDDQTSVVFSKKAILKQAALEQPHIYQLSEQLELDEAHLNIPSLVKEIQRKKRK